MSSLIRGKQITNEVIHGLAHITTLSISSHTYIDLSTCIYSLISNKKSPT